MSAADHPIRGALSLAAGAGFLVLAPTGVALVVAGGGLSTAIGTVLAWVAVRQVARAQRGWQP